MLLVFFGILLTILTAAAIGITVGDDGNGGYGCAGLLIGMGLTILVLMIFVKGMGG